MNLADIVGGQVVIHPDMLAIPDFKKVWDAFKDKDLATKYLWYIVLKNKYDSPYVETMERDRRRATQAVGSGLETISGRLRYFFCS